MQTIKQGIGGMSKSNSPVNFEEFTESLNTIFQSNSPTVAILSSAAREMASYGSAGVIAAVSELLKNKKKLEPIAKASYLHGNGFYRIPLFSNNVLTLRIHIWIPGVFAQENLHSHRWPMISTILKGVLQSELWVDSAVAGCTSYPEYLYLGQDKDLLPIGNAKVELKETRALRSKQTYIMMPHELHRIIGAHDPMTATFVCRPVECRAWARNIVVNSRLPSLKVSFLDEPQLVEVLAKYLSVAGATT